MLKYLILTFLYIEVSSKLVEHFNKRISHFNKDLSIAYSAGENSIFAHALCLRYEEIGPPKSEKRCRLILETFPSKPGLRPHRCEVELFARRKIGKIGSDYTLKTFGDDRLIFIWKEEIKRRVDDDDSEKIKNDYSKEFLRVRVVDMITCEYGEMNVVADKSGESADKSNSLNIVTYEDGRVELFFRNGNLCGIEKRCKLTYSPEDGKFSDRPVPFLPVKHDSSSEIWPILASNSSYVLGYVTRTRFYDEGSINFISADGKNILFDHLYSWSPFNLPRRISNIAIATEEEKFGFCQQEMFEPTIKCSLFNLQGNATLGIDIDIKSSDVALIRMRNTSNGGFLLLIAYVLDYSQSTFGSIDVLEINKYGELSRIRSDTGGFECPIDESGMDVDFFQKSDNGYCYYVACSWPGPWNNQTEDEDFKLNVYSQCYDVSEVVQTLI